MRFFPGQKGIATLVLVMIVLGVVTVITLFTARVILMDQKIYKNVSLRSSAANAAQAGFDYALGYLVSNASTVTATDLSSCPSTDTTYTLSAGTNSPLADNSTFTMTYHCIATNTDTLRITAVGTSFDSAATNTITALVKAWNGAFSNYAVVGRANGGGENSVNIRNTSRVYNTNAGVTTTVVGGGTVQLHHSAASRTSITSPYGAPYACAARTTLPGSITTDCKDISYSNATLNAMTNATDFQTNFIGRTISGSTNSFSSTSITPVYNLDCSSGNKTFHSSTTFASEGCTNNGSGGTTDTFVSASATARIIYVYMGSRNLTFETGGTDTSFTIGSASSPVILVINNIDSSTGDSGNIRWDADSGGDQITMHGNIYTNSTNFIQLMRDSNGTGTLNGILFSSGPVQVYNNMTVNGVVVGDRVDIRDAAAVYYTPANITNTYNGYYGSYLTPGAGGGANSYGIVSGSWKDF